LCDFVLAAVLAANEKAIAGKRVPMSALTAAH
jgi:hypothetical protein